VILVLSAVLSARLRPRLMQKNAKTRKSYSARSRLGASGL